MLTMAAEDFAGVVRRIVGDRSQRAVALKAGISHTTVHDMLLGRVPSPDIIRRFCDGLNLDARDRDELREAAGVRARAEDIAPDIQDYIRQAAWEGARLAVAEMRVPYSASVPPEPDPSPASILAAALAELGPVRVGAQDGILRLVSSANTMTVEEAEKLAADWRKQREEGTL